MELKKESIKGYIDSYENITLLVDKNIDNENKKFYLYDGKTKIELELINYYKEENFNKYIVKNSPSISLHKDYYILDEAKNKGYLRSGSIVRDKRFDEENYYDGPLGVEYHKDKSIFRIWSPVAKEIIVELIFNDDRREKHNLSINDKVWEYTHIGDLDGVGYIYHVRVFDKFVQVIDPYAISSCANALYNYVVDQNKFYKMKYEKPAFSGNYVDSIIYELNIKDFTQDLESKNKGCFLGLLENNPTKGGPTGMEYIKSLGITHVQLLPTFDFEGVDDLDKTAKYNWGYNPIQYFVPSGWYSINPDDPYSRINELLMLIDEFHKNGIRVNMDVVFNHVYETSYLAINKLVPGYDFRVDLGGNASNASGCGNVFATERKQVSRLVRDVLSYYAKVYNVSGFRFDLMGLLDIDTLNIAEEALREIDKTIMLYGEGWNMFNPLSEDLRPTIYNHKKIPGYAFFNDRFRDSIRGNQWNKMPGYSYNRESENFDLINLVKGSCQDFYRFSEPSQSINYVECHDNYTFYDFGLALGKEDFEVIDAGRLALEIILISEGIPFIHAGQEFFRTKQGVENSYNTRGLVNKFNYHRRDRYIDNIKTLIDLIKIRKEYDVLRLNSAKEISMKVHVLDGISSEHRTGFVFIGDNYDLFVVIKNNYKEEQIDFGGTRLIFDGFKKCDLETYYYTMKNPGVYIFRKDKKNENNW